MAYDFKRNLQLTFAIVFLCTLNAEFTPHFRDFLSQHYGRDTKTQLERLDMEIGLLNMGSFGGKLDASENVTNRPIIFVHGVTLRAGAFLEHRKFFMSNGYLPGELYATTYSDGGISSLFIKKMECKDVKQIRQFITAVAEYTKSKVDVIAYSMGTAISRKAILGGQCVETLEDLGAPITSLVDTYISLGGVAYGLESCSTYEKSWPSCNNINGMLCSSKYIQDVNSKKKRYEGQHSYAIYSNDDTIVGSNCCGKPCSELKNANLTIHKRAFDHVSIMAFTKELQFSLLKYRSGQGF